MKVAAGDQPAATLRFRTQKILHPAPCEPEAGWFATAVEAGAAMAPIQGADWMLAACLPFGPWVTSNFTF